MSSDTAKEDVSVVDSSATEWKQDIESPSYKGNQNGEPYRVKDTGETRERGRLCDTRYFIIKSLNHQNIQLSVEKGIWATQVMNEPILEDAFHNSGRVILIFSVNMSGFFQGYAQMISTVGWRRDNVWSQGNGKCNPWGRSFKVKWLRLNDLPFQRTLHLKNPLNDYKPVKISRDCQELSPDIGEALCELIDGQSNVDGLQMMRDNFPSKRPCAESPCSLGDEDYNMPPGHPSWSQSQTHVPYSSLAYQQQSEAIGYQLAYGRANGAAFSESLNVNSVAPKESPRASVLTEDDFLEMSYEEYLEAHSRSNRQLCRQASSAPPQMKQDSTRSKRHGEDKNLSFRSDRGGSRKRAHSSSRQQL